MKRLGRISRRAASSPSIDLYFANACRAALSEGGGARLVTPTVVRTACATLVVRHESGIRVRPSGSEGLIYLIDDAVFAAARDRSLPRFYRAKLALKERAAASRLLPRADVVVASTPEVAEDLPRRLLRPGADIRVIDPYWDMDPPSLDHFTSGEDWRIGFTGAQTHAASLGFAAAAAAPTLLQRPDATFCYSAGHAAPDGVPAARLRPDHAIRWPIYRATLPTRRLNVALYPLPDAPFARARSINKLIEHALLGAAPLYAAHWPRAARAVAAGAGVALPAELGAWREAVAMLSRDPDQARRLAEGAAALARRLNDPAPQRALWSTLLGLPPAPDADAR